VVSFVFEGANRRRPSLCAELETSPIRFETIGTLSLMPSDCDLMASVAIAILRRHSAFLRVYIIEYRKPNHNRRRMNATRTGLRRGVCRWVTATFAAIDCAASLWVAMLMIRLTIDRRIGCIVCRSVLALCQHDHDRAETPSLRFEYEATTWRIRRLPSGLRVAAWLIFKLLQTRDI